MNEINASLQKLLSGNENCDDKVTDDNVNDDTTNNNMDGYLIPMCVAMQATQKECKINFSIIVLVYTIYFSSL